MADARASGLLTERYRPKKLSEIIGNAAAVASLRRWAAGWDPGRAPPRMRAALLVGRAGVGKTTAAAALARERGWGLVEMNASEARNRDAIEQVAGRAALTNSFSDNGIYRPAHEGGRTLILLDEADCLSGRAAEERPRPAPVSLREFLRGRYATVEALTSAWNEGMPKGPAKFLRWEDVPASPGRSGWARLPAAQRDLESWRQADKPKDRSDRGGLGAIAKLVRTTRQPLVMTVNDPSPLQRNSSVFRQSVARIDFGPVEEGAVREMLRRIAAAEGLRVDLELLETIVRRSRGDVRAALTDLEAIAPLPPGPVQRTALGGRDASSDFEAFTA
ncbi:MAG: AAA family ATPase, partial [Thermoplasmata archaeon]